MEEKGKPPFLEGYKEGPHSLISGKKHLWILYSALLVQLVWSLKGNSQFPSRDSNHYRIIPFLQTRFSHWSSSSTYPWRSSTCSTRSAGGRSTPTWARWPTWPCPSRPRTWRSGTARTATSRTETAPSRCRSLRRSELHWERVMRQCCEMNYMRDMSAEWKIKIVYILCQ